MDVLYGRPPTGRCRTTTAPSTPWSKPQQNEGEEQAISGPVARYAAGRGNMSLVSHLDGAKMDATAFGTFSLARIKQKQNNMKCK